MEKYPIKIRDEFNYIELYGPKAFSIHSSVSAGENRAVHPRYNVGAIKDDE